MSVHQRDIIEVAFGNFGAHPAIVVSTPEILLAEGFFYAVLMSTKNIYPEFTYPITPEMINKPRNYKSGYALGHQLQPFYEYEIISRSGSSLKSEYFKELIRFVNTVIFDLK